MGLSLRQEIDGLLQKLHLDSNPLTPDRVTAFAHANDLENRAGKIREALRKVLLPEFVKSGVPTDKGVLLEGEGATVLLTMRRATPSMEAVQALCEAKGISTELVTDAVTTIKVSMSKLEALVERGVLKQDDLDGLSTTTPVLTGQISK